MSNRGEFIRIESVDDGIALIRSQGSTSLAIAGNDAAAQRLVQDPDTFRIDGLTISLGKVMLECPPDARPVVLQRAAFELLGAADASRLEYLAIADIALVPADFIRLQGLRSLHGLVLSSVGLGDDGARAVAASFPKLTLLGLGGNSVGADGARAIAAGIPDLSSLDVAGNALGKAGALAIVELLPNLRRLNLVGNAIGPDGVKAVTEGLNGLTALNLSGNPIGVEAAQAIAGRHPHLRSLLLGNCAIGDEGVQAIACGLPNLTALNLGGNRIGAESVRQIAKGLPLLEVLHLSGSGSGADRARIIAGALSHLAVLNLSGTGIGIDGIAAIADGLPCLTELHVSGKGVGIEGARLIAAGLPNLAVLNVSGNRFEEDVAQVIVEGLPNLKNLHLAGNRFGDIGARAIAHGLPNLTVLNLMGNTITVKGARAMAESLHSLTTLYMSGNRVGDEGAHLIAGGLKSLSTLDLSNNGIGDKGAQAIAEGLPNLTALFLSGNGVKAVGARALAERLPNLINLNLSGNSIKDPDAVLQALALMPGRRLRSLELRAPNAATKTDSRAELVESNDAQAILAAYRRLDAASVEEQRPFGEAKLVVLGDEAVGKTSLVRALKDGTPCDPNEKKTVGAAVHNQIWTTSWSPTVSAGSVPIALNIWDFGGQEILHQTHRYFLSDRCIHVVVLSSRREDERQVFDWLDTIRARSANSPVIVVVNKCDEGTHNLDLDFTDLRRKYPEIVAQFNVSCLAGELGGTEWMGPNSSLTPLRATIADLLQFDNRLESVRRGVPKSWVRVREEIRRFAAEEQVLASSRFATICVSGDAAADRVDDPAEQRALLAMLHQMGVVVAHGLTADTRSLNDLTLLDPNWLTDAIYALLGDGGVIRNCGIFDKASLGALLRTDQDRALLYPDDRLDYVLDLMQQDDFRLCFRLPENDGPPRYLLPEALPAEKPDGLGWDPTATLRFRYRYASLQRGLIPRFQVVGQQFFGANPLRWRSGCTMEVHGCSVLIDGDLGRELVDVHVNGPANQRRDALAAIRFLFDEVHSRVPECGARACVPLPDHPDVDVPYEHLLTLERLQGSSATFVPVGAASVYDVGRLLNGVGRWPDGEQQPLILREQGEEPLIVISNSPGAIVGDSNSSGPVNSPRGATGTLPSSTSQKEGGLGRMADLISIWAVLTGCLGVLAAWVHLHAKSDGYPWRTFVEYGAAASFVGGILGLLVALRRR